MPRVLLKTGAITSLAIFILQGCGGPTGRPVNYNKTQGEALADTENCRYQAGIGKGGGGFVFGPLILVAPIAMINGSRKF
jgi:hypothetical protein